MSDLSRDLVARIREVIGDPKGVIPLHEPTFAGEEWALVKDCLDKGWVSSGGKYVDRLEAETADLCGASHAIAVVTGTAALHVALLLAGVEPGDEVLVQSLTFVATANAVNYARAIPHFVDADRLTLGLDPDALAAYLTLIADRDGERVINRRTGRRIAAVVPMHTFGHPVDVDGLARVAAEYEIPVVEDAAEALGSTFRGRPCGSFGRIGTLSFNGNKIVTTGGGGMILTEDEDLARFGKHLTTTAKLPHRWAFVHDRVGFNYRLPNLNAALGCAQLAQLPRFLAAKRALAARYQEAFHDVAGLTFFTEPEGACSNYWLNTILINEEHADERDALLEAANDAGLMCRPAWEPMHRLPMYANCPRAPLPVTEELARRIISVPSSASLGEA